MTYVVRGRPAGCRRLVTAAERPSTSSSESTYADTYTLAYRLTGNEEDARDVVQEAYLRAYRGVRQFRGDAQFSTWLYRITANCASTHVGAAGATSTTARRRLAGESTPVPSPIRRRGPTPRPPRSQLEAALAELPPRLRAVVVLRDVYDLPTRRSPPSSASPRRPRRFVCTEPVAGCASRCSTVATTVDELRMRCADAHRAAAPRRPRGNPVPGRAARATSSTACGARPTSAQHRRLHRGLRQLADRRVSAPGQSGSKRCSAAIDEANTSGRRPDALRRAAVLGGMAAVTAAGAASVLVLSTRRGAGSAGADCSGRSGGPLLRLGVPTCPRAVAQLEELRSPKPVVGGSSPSCPAQLDHAQGAAMAMNRETKRMMQRQGQIGS